MEQPQVQRRLAAILAADVAGYSRLTEADEEGTLARLKALRQELIDPAIASARGRVVKTMGDGILIEFASAVDAVRCALDVQRGVAARNAGLAPDTRIEFRVGIHVGDVVVDGADLLGDGVNIAARLEGLSETGGISISEDAWRQVQGKVAADFVDLGEQTLKNIARPVRVYRVATGSGGAPAALALPDKPSIAVLPFQNMSGDAEQEYFCDGMVEDIITALSKVRWFFVIARNSSFTYKGKAVDTKQVARELGVRYVIEGSVRRAGSRLRVTAQLIDATSGNHIWAERYDRELADLFMIQDEITASVVASIEPHLYAAEDFRATRKPPDSLNAWECVVRALGLLNSRARDDIATARSLLSKAIGFDANYGRAYALFAYATALEAVYGWTPYQETLAAAGEAANKATLLDVDDPWAHFAVGYVARSNARADDAVIAYRRALAINPNFAWGHSSLGAALVFLGRPDEALAEIDIAERLSPRDVFSGMNQLFRSFAHFVAERYQEGIVCARTSLQENPNLVNSLRCLVINCAMAGEIGEARSALARLKRLVPDRSSSLATLGIMNLTRQEDRQRMVEAFRLAESQ